MTKEERNARLRDKYANDPEYRKKRHAYTKRFSLSNIGRLRQAIRAMTWGLFAGELKSNRKLAELGMGKPLDEIRSTSGDGDSTDHIVPICQFNLWDPVQLLQAIHWSNIRRVPISQNREKGYKRADVDISSLPYVNTPEAIQAAQDVIDRHKYKAAQNSGPIKLRSAKAIPGLDFVRLAS